MNGVTTLISEETKGQQGVSVDITGFISNFTMDAEKLSSVLEIELLNVKFLSLRCAIVILVSIGELHLHRSHASLVRVDPDVPHRTVIEDALMLAVAARVTNEGHAAGGRILRHSVHMIVVILQSVLVDDNLLVFVVISVHLDVQLESINPLLIVADRD